MSDSDSPTPSPASSGKPTSIQTVTPNAAIPGGELIIRGSSLSGAERARARFDGITAPVIIGSDAMMIVRVPEGASEGNLELHGAAGEAAWHCDIGIQIAEKVHPVANPVVDEFGNVYTTLSGSAGQKTPVSIYKLAPGQGPEALTTGILNATGLAIDTEGVLYTSSRAEGVVYQISPSGNAVNYVEGMGVATGIVFDRSNNLYVGDRGGTIFKVGADRQIYVYATLEPSIAAYHMAFGPDGYLYVTGPTTSSYDTVYRIDPDGVVEPFFRGLGRPQGLAFDIDGNLYVVGSLSGRRGVVRIDADSHAELFLSGSGIVGIAFAPGKSMIVATKNALFRVRCGVEGRPLP